MLVILDIFFNNKILIYFHFFGILLINIRILLELRIIKSFRHLTGMLVKTLIKLKYFMVFFIGYLITYGFLD